MKILLLLAILFFNSCAYWPAVSAGLSALGGKGITANIGSRVTTTTITNNCSCETHPVKGCK